MKEIFKKLSFILTKRDKKLAKYLIIFSIIIALIETIGISVIMPFIAVASDFELITTNQYYSYIYNLFNFINPVDFVVVFGILLICFYIFRSTINLFYFYMLLRFSQGRYHLFSYRLFENYVGMSYKRFIDKNSSNLTKTIVTEAQLLSSVLEAILFIISELFVIILIYSIMLFVNYKVTLVLTMLLFINALFLTKTISKKIKKEGVEREKFQKKFFEIINSTMSNFKIIKLRSNSNDILNKFKSISYKYTKSSITSATLSHFPRLFLEAIGFGVIVFMITGMVWKYEVDITPYLPMISMFVLGLYRLLPSVNRIMTGYNTILYNIKALDIIHNDLMYDPEQLKKDRICFSNDIVLKNLYFAYQKDNYILKDVNLIINKGSKIAFIGESGSGKSTLVDIIIGLFKPIKGNILVDGELLSDNNIKDFRSKVGYIPQSVYLFDGTVAQNVAFGFDFNEEKVKKSLLQANILEFLEGQQDGIYTKVGEGGIKISGGQGQRIAIARALYNNPEILILDEATSALDSKTESKIMDEIYNVSSDKTLIIIAHRLSTLKRCEKIYKIENCKLKEMQKRVSCAHLKLNGSNAY